MSVKKMDIKEFREKGFLQEANRLFFHPLGLALEVQIDYPNRITEKEKSQYSDPIDHPNAIWKLGRIWDYRDDPEGMLFSDGTIKKERILQVEELRQSKKEVRASLKECNQEGIQIK